MGGDRLGPYLCDLHRAWLAHEPRTGFREQDASLVFFDISGFTPLTERLAKRGKAGVEQLIDTLNGVVAPLVDTAAALGGDTLKFGGDALLLLFAGDEHERRACAAAHDMQGAMEPFRRMRTDAGHRVAAGLGGVASGPVQLVSRRRSLPRAVVAGPTTSEVMGLEKDAEAGEVLLGPATLARLDEPCHGPRRGDGVALLTARPRSRTRRRPWRRSTTRRSACRARCTTISARCRERAPPGDGRLRAVPRPRRLLARAGPQAAAAELDALAEPRAAGAATSTASRSSRTDADRGAGKLFLVAGAPTASTDDEDRMLLALREIVAHDGELRMRAGVNRGRAFAVHLGAPQRRTYTTMGDTTNLAARVMGKAPDGAVLATRAVLDHARAPFALTPVAPFAVKGKRALVDAELVGAPRAAAAARRRSAAPLAGRERELRPCATRSPPDAPATGASSSCVGEPGIGKSRLVAEVAAEAERAGCAASSSRPAPTATSTPYFALRAPLRAARSRAETRRRGGRGARPVRPRASAAERAAAAAHRARRSASTCPPTAESARLSSDASATQLHLLVDRLLAALLPARGTLVVIEDAHWLDEASSDLLRTRAAPRRRARLDGARHAAPRRRRPRRSARRPTLASTWQPLAPEAARVARRRAAAQRALAPHVAAALVERANGNPLFLRELAAAARGGARLDELPDTVEALLTARIDTLAPGATAPAAPRRRARAALSAVVARRHARAARGRAARQPRARSSDFLALETDSDARALRPRPAARGRLRGAALPPPPRAARARG